MTFIKNIFFPSWHYSTHVCLLDVYPYGNPFDHIIDIMNFGAQSLDSNMSLEINPLIPIYSTHEDTMIKSGKEEVIQAVLDHNDNPSKVSTRK